MEKQVIIFGEEYTYENLSVMTGVFYADFERYQKELVELTNDMLEPIFDDSKKLRLDNVVHILKCIANDVKLAEYVIREWNSAEITTCYCCRVDTTQIIENNERTCIECFNVYDEEIATKENEEYMREYYGNDN